MPEDPQNPDSLSDDRTFTGEREATSEEQQSLGDDRTFAGEQDAPPDEQQSLGDQATAGDALSSISDLELDGQAVDSDLPLIDLAARFEMEGELGKGGMGAVQLATDRQLKRKVAIKRIHASSPSALARFVTEAQSIAALSHFNIVQVHDFGRDTDGPLLIMEYVSGGSLLDRLKEGKLEVEDAIGITCQLCDALAVAHQKGIIHRDIKPANILLTEEGVPKLTDFGLARQESVDHGQTMTGTVMGTLDFMPPEQRQDATAVDARSDLWSLAATLYQMLTGKSPKVIRIDQLPANLATVIGKMLEEDPEERFQNADEFKAELRKGMAAATTTSTDLAAGVCPSCGAANDASRRFCHQCAESLVKTCLSCMEVAVLNDICKRCGSRQDEQRDLIRNRLAVVIEESLALARGHEYEKALAQLETVKDDEHTFTADVRQQAVEQVKLVTAERDRQYQLRDQLVDLANQHNRSYDYAAAVKELEKIPAPLRTGNSIADKLLNAQGSRDELASLMEEIRQAAKTQQLAGLLEKTSRYLQLKPNELMVLALHDKLQAKVNRERPQIEAIIAQAQAAYDSQQDETVLTILDNWPKALHKPASVDELQRMATYHLTLVKDLKTQLLFAKDTAEKLSLVKQYLQLRPADAKAQQLASKLQRRLPAGKPQQEQADAQRKPSKFFVIAGSALLIGCLLIGGGYLVHSFTTANASHATADRENFKLLPNESKSTSLADEVAAKRKELASLETSKNNKKILSLIVWSLIAIAIVSLLAKFGYPFVDRIIHRIREDN